MTNALRPPTWLVVAALVVAGCGGGNDTAGEAPDDTDPPTTMVETPSTTSDGLGDPDGGTPTPSSATTTTDPSAPSSDSDWCAALDQDEPPPDLADLVPSEFADATQTLLDITGMFDSLEASIPSDVIDRLAAPETSNGLAALAELAERQCGPSESVDGLRAYAQISALAGPAAQPDYCGQLATVLSLEASDDESASALVTALDVAPDEHAQALATLQALIASDGIPDELDPTQALVAAAGLGLYAEARCDVADSFATMLFIGAFLSAGEDFPGQTGQGIGVAPEPADPGPATSALPAGSDLTFEVIEIDLEDDGDYLASVIVPAGWERDDSLFGSVFEPADGFGIFTEMTVDTGCDGLCEANDWAARLNATDGFITQFRQGDDALIIDRPTEGTPGIVMTRPAFGDSIEGVVVRWTNAADRYFVCDFRLSEQAVDHVDAFITACESARPGWITDA